MKKSIFLLLLLAIGLYAKAQHEHHTMPADTTRKPADTLAAKKEMHHDHSSGMQTDASHAFSRQLPMSRNGSGTGWNPDTSPMYMWLRQKGSNSWMFHGSLFMRYTAQDIFSSGSRGGSSLSAPNWMMVMFNRKTGRKGLLNANLMLSLDRLTEGGNGYPLLYQSGETYKGKSLVDRQHPHDLFSALSLGYTHGLNKHTDLFVYLGYPGEPALGATAFMHRISSMNNPDAPLGHHWQDATHISFGTGTIGLRYRTFKLEGSVFTGREPDEERFGFDKARFDSYSYRLSWNPGANWAVQFSQGFIKDAEPDEPGWLTRSTASVIYTRQLKNDRHFAATSIWGLNDRGAAHQEHSLLLEGNYQLKKEAVYSRYEWVQKGSEELQLGTGFPHRNYNIHSLTLGYNRKLFSMVGLDWLAGTQVTLYQGERLLDPLYGKNPLSGQFYIQIRPGRHRH